MTDSPEVATEAGTSEIATMTMWGLRDSGDDMLKGVDAAFAATETEEEVAIATKEVAVTVMCSIGPPGSCVDHTCWLDTYYW